MAKEGNGNGISDKALSNFLTDFFGESGLGVDQPKRHAEFKSKLPNRKELTEYFGYPISDEQYKVVTWNDVAPLVINSCAGSGKTTSIISNMVYRVNFCNVDPSEILAVTFTRKATREMEDRYKNMAGSGDLPNFSTFHSLFYHMFTEAKPANTFDGKYKVVGMMDYMHELSPYMDKTKTQDRATLAERLRVFEGYRGYCINTMNRNVTLEAYPDVTLDSPIFKQYTTMKRLYNSLDFEDMQLGLYKLLLKHDETSKMIKEKFQANYHYIYLDEYQDINPLQIAILTELMEGGNIGLVAIGDADQSIYRFRGSDPSFIRNFKQRHVGAKELNLTVNYRCKDDVVKKAYSVARKNSGRDDLMLKGFNEGGKIYVNNCSSELGGVRHIMSILEDRVKNGDLNYSDFAVLIRNNSTQLVLLNRLLSSDVPVCPLSGTTYLLSNNSLYKKFIDIIVMCKNKDTDIFKRIYRSCEGFKYIKRGALKELEGTNWYDYFIENPKKNYLDIETQARYKALHDSDSALELFQTACIVYKDTLQYQITHHYRSADECRAVISELMYSANNLLYEDFLDMQRMQANNLERYINTGKGVQVSTIHSVKGLEFKECFILNVSQGKFPSLGDAFNNLQNLSTLRVQLGKVEGNVEDDSLFISTRHWLRSLESFKPLNKDVDGDFVLWLSGLALDVVVHYKKVINDPELLKKTLILYQLFFKPTVEEERRLFYVAITRSENDVWIEVCGKPSILMLDFNDYDVDDKLTDEQRDIESWKKVIQNMGSMNNF